MKTVLVTGFGIKSVSSLVYSSAAQAITATVAAGHKYLVDQVVELSGANESGFNGEFRVLSVTSTNVVVGLDNGTPAAASATGTLSMKIPSLGWAVEFEDVANYKIIFKRSSSISATPLRIYIDNSAWTGWNNNGGCLAKVLMIENPTDINTFTTVYETRWPCSHNYGATEWQIVGDGWLLYFMPTYGSAVLTTIRRLFAFGDISSIRPGDNYNCLMIGYYSLLNDSSLLSYVCGNNALKFRDSTHSRLARSHHQLPGAVPAYWLGLQDYFGEGMSFPNPADNGFYVVNQPIPVFDDVSYRGSLPGIRCPMATTNAYDTTNIKNLPLMPDSITRLLLVQKIHIVSGSDYRRLIGFDIKGPWR
ncbi:hypothetical protein [uncultured Tolumonas sp.]|uniref:hypothetical protein n=1 Tax=uncultured Tolumonas sp. TaxID=263765 RepID=UPI002A0A20B3|nr:hypothetical protein [uncultured Tolumonas sp.]